MAGDVPSPNAASPFKRMGRHLDPKMLRNPSFKYLETYQVPPRDYKFVLIARGPLFAEAPDTCKRKKPWSNISGL